MTTDSNGNVYAAVSGGDIYKQTGGTGNFLPLGQTARGWAGMTTDPGCVRPTTRGVEMATNSNT